MPKKKQTGSVKISELDKLERSYVHLIYNKESGDHYGTTASEEEAAQVIRDDAAVGDVQAKEMTSLTLPFWSASRIIPKKTLALVREQIQDDLVTLFDLHGIANTSNKTLDFACEIVVNNFKKLL